MGQGVLTDQIPKVYKEDLRWNEKLFNKEILDKVSMETAKERAYRKKMKLFRELFRESQREGEG